MVLLRMQRIIAPVKPCSSNLSSLSLDLSTLITPNSFVPANLLHWNQEQRAHWEGHGLGLVARGQFGGLASNNWTLTRFLRIKTMTKEFAFFAQHYSGCTSEVCANV